MSWRRLGWRLRMCAGASRLAHMPKQLPGRSRVNQNFSLYPSTIEAIHRLMKVNAEAIAEHRGGRASLSAAIEWLVETSGRDDGLLEMAQVARMLGVSRDKVQYLTATHGLPCHRVEHRVLYSRAEVREWVASR